MALACRSGLRGTLHPRYQAHTVTDVPDEAALLSLGPEGTGRLRSVKFVITEFGTPQARVHLLDGRFYAMHDEWYWYQLLNGRARFGDEPLRDGPGFSSVAAAAAHVRTHGVGGLALAVLKDGRIYSDHFYLEALSPGRDLAVGSLVRLPASGGRAAPRWAFELEYTDEPDARILNGYFSALGRVLPRAIGRRLMWLTRSPAQALLAATLVTEQPELATRVTHYADLSVVGDVEIYHSGTAMGRLLFARAATETLASAGVGSIVVVDHLPDQLPQAAAFVSTVPQTPLSHLNILAQSRGIPSAYVGGLAEDPFFTQLARAQAPVILQAEAAQVRLTPLTEAEYAELSSARPVLSQLALPEARAVDDVPYTVALEQLEVAQLQGLSDLIGGKAFGLGVLAQEHASDVPRPLLAISVRTFVEHLAPLRPTLVRMLEDPLFRRTPAVRFLVLEGVDGFRTRFGATALRQVRRKVAERGGVLQALVEAGGVRRRIATTPLPAPAQAAIDAALRSHFGGLPARIGLRFRSSATVEDVDGFTGAGLYASHTGYLTPPPPKPGKRARRQASEALRETMASYFSFEAFEERRSAGIDHLGGRMAVVVHPRFDDARELANGVITFALFAPDAPERARMLVNVQRGALSVTNPPTDSAALPEIDRVSLADGAVAPSITRVRGSTELPEGSWLLDDAALRALFLRCQAVAQDWLARTNSGLGAARQARMQALDFEFKRVTQNWPANPAAADSPGTGARLVLKQVRSLEPAARLDVFASLDLPVPRDLARRAVQLQRRSCQIDGGQLTLLEVLTAPDAAFDAGFSRRPFVASVTLTDGRGSQRLEHPDFSQPDAAGRIALAPNFAAQLQTAHLTVPADGCKIAIEARDRSALLRELATRGQLLGTSHR